MSQKRRLSWKGKHFIFHLLSFSSLPSLLLLFLCFPCPCLLTFFMLSNCNKLYRKKFQTIMASATLHNGIRQLAFVALHKPVYIGLKPQAVSEFSSKSICPHPLSLALSSVHLPSFSVYPYADIILEKRADIESGQTYNTPTKLTQYSAVVRTKDRPSSLISFLKEHVKYVGNEGN